MPLEDRPRSCWIVGAAIETMVWSMKVIATAKIIAVRIRLRDRPPMLLLIGFSPPQALAADSQYVRAPGPRARRPGYETVSASVRALMATRFPTSCALIDHGEELFCPWR
jgi:hypothetical protein